MGSGEPRVQPLSCPPAETAGMGRGGGGGQATGVGTSFQASSLGEGPFSGRVWGRAPFRHGDITHRSSRPLALHLLPLLPPPLHPPPLRSHWVHQLLPGIWGRNRQTDSSPCSRWGWGERVKSQAATGMEALSPAAHHFPGRHLRILWRLWRLRSR